MSKQFHIGAQNDQLLVTFGEPPALDNDYPNHNADRLLHKLPGMRAEL